MKQYVSIMWLVVMSGSLWAGDAAKVVTLNRSPLGSELVLHFTEELRLGPDDGDDYLWTGPNTAIEADRRGHMFITDDNENRIVELDASGTFVKQHGRPGEGPGEFQFLRSFQFLEKGALAFENLGGYSAITYYDDQLQVKDRKVLSGLGFFPRSLAFSPDGQFASGTVTKVDVDSGEEVTQILLMDAELKLKKDLLTWRSPALNPAKATDSKHWAEFLSRRFDVLSKGANVFVTYDRQGFIYTAPATAYVITKWRADLTKVAEFRCDYRPIPQPQEEVDAIVSPIRQSILSHLPPQLQSVVSEAVVARAVELAEFPPVKFPIAGLRTMEDGTLLVFRDLNARTSVDMVDLISPDGAFLGSVSLPNQALRRMVFRNGKAYTLEVDEEEQRILVRYGLRKEWKVSASARNFSK